MSSCPFGGSVVKLHTITSITTSCRLTCSSVQPLRDFVFTHRSLAWIFAFLAISDYLHTWICDLDAPPSCHMLGMVLPASPLRNMFLAFCAESEVLCTMDVVVVRDKKASRMCVERLCH